MELLERYLRQIRHYLPFKERNETIDELRSLILDQVDEATEGGLDEEQALRNIISDMGAPQVVANRYNENGPLIRKDLEPIMMMVIKIVAITLPLVILFAESIGFVTDNENFTFMEFLLNIAYAIPGAMYSLIVSIGMIFIGFAVIGHYFKPRFHVEEKPFNPDLLPEIPTKMMRVSTFGSTITILILVAALYVFNFQKGLVGVFYDGNSYPLLNQNFDRIVAFFNISWFATILLHAYYLYRQKKSIASKTVEFILGIYGGLILIYFGTSDVFTTVVIEGYNLDIVPTLLKYILIIVGSIAIIGNIADYVKMFINLDSLDTINKKNNH